MSDTVIQVENLGKKYIIGHQQEGRSRYVALRDVIADGARSLGQKIRHPGKVMKPANQEEFWALKDVSFEVKRGEVVGIIGRNGAGKSTLLKILSRITEPTTGRVKLKGRVASLLEVGTGFHPELTGRENIFLNGAILGMSKAEINRKFDEIVEFAEIYRFLDTPVKRYSSGMYVRLAFAVAAHLEPEILVVDEVLAVGDFEFQKKCLGKMQEVSTQEGRAIIFVSHNIAAIKSLCNRGLFMCSGEIKSQGSLDSVLRDYLSAFSSDEYGFRIDFQKKQRKAQICSIHIKSIPHEESCFSYSQDIEFEVECNFREPTPNTYLGINILNQYQEPVIFWRDFELLPELLEMRKKGYFSYCFTLPGNTLSPGLYSISLALIDQISSEHLHVPKESLLFRVEDNESIRSIKRLPWKGLTSIPLRLKVFKREVIED